MSTSHFANLILRRAEESDRIPYKNLGRLAFAPTKTLTEMEESGDRPFVAEGRQPWVVVDQRGDLSARYYQFGFALYFAGVRYEMAGVGGVAVAPERRSQGVAQWMLTQALHQFREQEIPLSMLYPFRQSFYRKLGWARVGITHQYRVSSRWLPLDEKRSQIRAYQPHYEKHFITLYEKVAVQHNGWLDRPVWWWQEFFKPKGGREMYGYWEGNTLHGYVVIEFAQLEPEKDQLAVIVREWVAQTPQAYRGVVGFLGSLRDQVTTIVWNTYPDDPFPHLLKEQERDPALTLPHFNFNYLRWFGITSGGFMWRLVNPREAIALRPIQPGAPFSLSFQLTDPVFGADQFTVEFANGKTQISSQSATTMVKISVEHLTQLFCGVRRSRQLHWTGELEIEGNDALLDRLDTAWSAQPPFCWDAF